MLIVSRKSVVFLFLTLFMGNAMSDPVLSPCPNTPNCVSSQAGDEAHFIEPISFQGDMVSAKQRLKQVLASLPRFNIVAETENSLKATQTSLIFRFVDDVDFIFDPTQNLIHVRSASRVGKSDLGVNRKRVENIRQMLSQQQ